WQPNGGIYRDAPTSTDPLFAGVTLPKVPFNTGQPELMTTRTLLINGSGRGGAGLGPLPAPQLYAFDKASGHRVGAIAIPQVNTAVPMTFMHQGRQYIVFASGAGDCTKLIALTLPR